MSRTYRRKNSWDKFTYVDAWLNDENLYADLIHRGVGGFHGCTKEQVTKKLNAWWYGEVPRNWTGNRSLKEYSRWKLRATNKQELIKAMKTCEEENLMLTEKRVIKGLWWYYYT